MSKWKECVFERKKTVFREFGKENLNVEAYFLAEVEFSVESDLEN